MTTAIQINYRLNVNFSVPSSSSKHLNQTLFTSDPSNQENDLVAFSNHSINFSNATKLYTASSFADADSSQICGWGVYCPSDLGLNDRGRLEVKPTHFRSQIWAIHRALSLVRNISPL